MRHTTAMPLYIQDKRDSKTFLKDAQKAFRRRGELSWQRFDDFKNDLRQVCFVEHVFFSEDPKDKDMWAGTVEIRFRTKFLFFMILACSCFDGVKGRICDHVLALYFDRKIMRPLSEQHIVGRFKRDSNGRLPDAKRQIRF